VETALQRRGGREKVNLRRTFHTLLATHPRLRGRFAGAREIPGSLRGWQIPCGSERRRIAGEGWMLIGDAASLVDPFSGEGIANALVSAKLAAEQAVEAHAARRAGALLPYEARLWQEMGRGMQAAYRLQRAARYRPLVDFVIGLAANQPLVKETIVELFAEPETLGQLTHPSYLWKLLLLSRKREQQPPSKREAA
jgi:flavin-dependent dehydrogenase